MAALLTLYMPVHLPTLCTPIIPPPLLALTAMAVAPVNLEQPSGFSRILVTSSIHQSSDNYLTSPYAIQGSFSKSETLNGSQGMSKTDPTTQTELLNDTSIRVSQVGSRFLMIFCTKNAKYDAKLCKTRSSPRVGGLPSRLWHRRCRPSNIGGIQRVLQCTVHRQRAHVKHTKDIEGYRGDYFHREHITKGTAFRYPKFLAVGAAGLQHGLIGADLLLSP